MVRSKFRFHRLIIQLSKVLRGVTESFQCIKALLTGMSNTLVLRATSHCYCTPPACLLAGCTVERRRRHFSMRTWSVVGDSWEGKPRIHEAKKKGGGGGLTLVLNEGCNYWIFFPGPASSTWDPDITAERTVTWPTWQPVEEAWKRISTAICETDTQHVIETRRKKVQKWQSSVSTCED